MNKNTAPACGVADYEQTWEQFYDAANLRATYSFMQGAGAGYEGAGAGYQGFTGRAGLGSAALQEIQPPANWSRAQDWSPVRGRALPQDRHYSAGQGNITVLRKNIWKPVKNIFPAPSSSSVLDQLTVSTLPAVMEYRVCDMLLALR